MLVDCMGRTYVEQMRRLGDIGLATQQRRRLARVERENCTLKEHKPAAIVAEQIIQALLREQQQCVHTQLALCVGILSVFGRYHCSILEGTAATITGASIDRLS
jgi:hypothetical protein